MRSVIKGRRIVEDRWQSIADDAELPAGAVIVALARWRRERAALLARDEPVGVRLPNTADVTELAEDLPKLAVVALEFPKFSDGRAYSQARLLRERFGYRGEIRAVGDVLRDQLFFMARSGFDAFELREDRSLEEALAAFGDFSESYQPAADQPQPLYRRAR
ncbi:MAG: DUF934 domain-containing protein [Candidatus Competibacteraceae bacterium]|nr:DUF934 domain-containing protein [Candidatus Competibacteraceae bacterium]MBK7982247.1 DUF934 domain-containing protein [Candidatus Competibacteraceae bacterium]MBK8899203.1 DUF934 domain-containing protein [Candidatus Competibacteraceae bacterium]MBK9952204.1 DUF934 domain-containing protein [Candidatus Competibacteraceae bacterium]